MADENTSPSIDDTMSRVLADIATRESSGTVEPPPAAPVASVESGPVTMAPEATESTSGDRPRGPDGKFIPKADTSATATPVQAEPTAGAAPATAPSGPPESWTAEAKANIWPALTPAAQAEIIRREKAVTDGLSQKSAELERYKPLESVLGPRRAQLAAEFGDEVKGVQTLFALSDFAAKDAPGFIRWFAQQRGIDIGSLAGTTVGQQQTEQVSADPTIAALQQEIATLKQSLTGFTQQQEQAQTAQLTSQIEAFKADPKNVHFEAVRADMAALMQGGRAKTLQEAYDQAVYANPTTRSLVMEESRRAAEAQQAAERAKAVEEAKRIRATNVVSDGSVGAAPTKPKSWQETLDNRARELNAA